MNTISKSLLATVAAATALLGAALPAAAESTYGYNAAGNGTPPLTTSARLNVSVTVPLLIMLRVGAATGTGDTVAFTGSFTGGVPGGPATFADGNNQAATWNGTAPVFAAASTTNAVAAFGWTNATGGGSVNCLVTTQFPPGSGLTSASITVASTTTAGGGLAHPGASTACGGTPTTFARNTLVSSTWTYSLSAAALASVTPGTKTEVITYTATTL